MELFLPSLFLMLLAYFFTVMFIPKLSPFIIIGGSIAFIGFTVYNHYVLFENEYKIMSWADTAKQFAPTLIVLLIIALMGGYLIYISTSGKGTLPRPPDSIPPPETATNYFTQAIGNGLVAAGTPVRTNNAIANTAHMPMAESLLDRAA